MPLESFFTVQNNLPVKSQPPVKTPIVSEKDPEDEQIDGQNFLDFILTKLGESSGENGEGEAVLGTTGVVSLVEQGDLKTAELVIAEIEGLTEVTQLDGELSLENTLELNKLALKDILQSLNVEDGLIIEGDEIPEELAGLLNLNLTPAQLSALQDGETPEDLPDDIFSAIIALTPAQQPEAVEAGLTSLSQDMAARLNALNVGEDGDARQQAQILKYLESFKALAQTKTADTSTPANNNTPTGGTAPVVAQNVSAQGSFESMLQGWPFSMDGSLLAPFDSGLSDALSGQTPASANATQMGTLTSLIGQSQGAGHTHPATQMVAVNIQKAAGKGDSTNLTLQLDPPEFGRVEVRLSFSKDNVLKTTVIAEKPETYLMLQRDVQALERAIQDIGLDSDGGVAFELAEQGFDFGQDNQRGGGHDKGGTGAGEEESEEIIESTMTWHVDPDSGHMRYDILV